MTFDVVMSVPTSVGNVAVRAEFNTDTRKLEFNSVPKLGEGINVLGPAEKVRKQVEAGLRDGFGTP